MADNTNIDPGPTPSVPVASDDIGGVAYQRVKPVHGADGSATDTSSAAPLPVVQTGTPALPTGAATESSAGAAVTSLGAVGDAAYVSGSGSVVALLKGLFAKLPALVSGRVPVDGSGVTQPVSGTFFQATQPVSGTVTATGPLTDTQLRAAPVPVSGTVTASGPLTDAQLRAAPVPVSGTVTATPTGTQAVSIAALPALVAGTANIGDVDVLSLPALPAGSNNIGDVDVLTLPALPAGTNAIGKLAPNSGVDIGDVDVTSLPALPAGNNNIGDVDIASSVTLPTAEARATTGAAPSAFTSTTSAQVFASNAARKLFTIYNNSDQDCYLMLAAAAASATSFHVIVKANGGFFSTTDYSGEIRGIMAATITVGQVNPGEYT